MRIICFRSVRLGAHGGSCPKWFSAIDKFQPSPALHHIARSYDPPTILNALSAPTTPRYCASSKMEIPLRSELAKRRWSLGPCNKRRSAEKTDPTAGRSEERRVGKECRSR